jgi:isocitrate dehydrogenase (NAD+)
LLLAATMMLDHIDRSELAHQLRKAIHQTLNEDKVRTGDMGGTASTKEFARPSSAGSEFDRRMLA